MDFVRGLIARFTAASYTATTAAPHALTDLATLPPVARIDYPDLAALDPELTQFISDKPRLNVARMLLHAPGIASAFLDLGVQQFRSLELSGHMRELAILACSRAFAAAYEWEQHVPISRV
jgi:alkylhydroperoxidase family enzyme